VLIWGCCRGDVCDGVKGRDGEGGGMRWLDVAFCRLCDDVLELR